MRFVIVTGMSGSGKSSTLKFLEDSGFYCVDNLPVDLIENFVEVVSQNEELTKLALGVDVRSGRGFDGIDEKIKSLKKKGYPIEVLFLECEDAKLIKRYKETRRKHPLSEEGRVEEGILKERDKLIKLKADADYLVDTTNLLTRELKEEITKIILNKEEYKNLIVTIVSFGFKNGIPSDADLVFDVRFLPNPFYIDELKTKTGNDKEVSDYVMKFEESETFLNKLYDMLDFLVPNYIKEGKSNLVVAIGCTGGKHRSVTLANELFNRMKGKESYGVNIFHRDVNNQGK